MKKNYYKIIYVLLGLLVAFMSAGTGYWLAAAIDFVTDENMSFMQAVEKVMRAPFAYYVNDYTLVIMFMTLVLFQSVFFLCLLLVANHAANSIIPEEMSDEKQTIANVPSTFFDNVINIENDIMHNQEESAFAMNFVFPGEDPHEEFRPQFEQGDFIDPDKPETEAEEKKELELFSSDVVMELLLQYDKDQIMEMKKLTQYIDNLTVAILKRMFKPNMAAEDIREYIEIFYGDKEV